MTIYRGTVVTLAPGGPVVALPISRIPGNIGPILTLVADLDVGDVVAVEDSLDGRSDQFVIVGRFHTIVSTDPPPFLLAGYAGGYAGGY